MTPAWKSWPLDPAKGVMAWRVGECAMCGKTDGPTFTDHCHLTGLVRGHLCRSCNNHEGASNAPHWQAWRAWDNPAKALNSAVLYEWGRYDPTPLHYDADLAFLFSEEREAWWAEQEKAAAEGRDWPTPITVDIAPRRAVVNAQLRAAACGIPGASS